MGQVPEQLDTGALNHEEIDSQELHYSEQKRKEQADARKRQHAAKQKT